MGVNQPPLEYPWPDTGVEYGETPLYIVPYLAGYPVMKSEAVGLVMTVWPIEERSAFVLWAGLTSGLFGITEPITGADHTFLRALSIGKEFGAAYIKVFDEGMVEL